MPHYLLIDDASGANWRIPEGADPEGLRQAIRDAMEEGMVVDVAVQTADNPPKNVTLTVNGKAVSTVAILTLA